MGIFCSDNERLIDIQWIFRVLRRKGLAEELLDRIKNQYIDQITFPVINNIPGSMIENNYGSPEIIK